AATKNDTGATTTTLTTLSANALVVDAFGSSQALGNLAAGSGQTQRWTKDSGSTSSGGMSTKAVATPGSASMTWAQTGSARRGEASGTTATDQKGANNGTYAGGVTLGQTGTLPGDSDKAALFNGSTGYVDTTDNASLQLSSGTLELWLKTSNAGSGYRAVAAK